MLSHRPNPPVRPRRCRGTRPRRGERGFTLLELLVVIAVLGIIVVPLASALSLSLRATSSIGAQIDASNAQDSITGYFTGDVASLDPTGFNTVASTACQSASWTSADTLLANFNSTNASGVTNRVSYWVTGSGRNIALIRRSCAAIPNYNAVSTGGNAVTLATNVGNFTSVAATTITGGRGTSGTTVCDEYACTIKVNGRFSYSITAQRRSFGAGVPVQAGKLYSYSGTLFQHYDLTTGQKTIKEQPWGGLYLPPGLVLPSSQNVYFVVQSQQGYYLNSQGTAFDATAGSVASAPQLPATAPSASNAYRYTLPISNSNIFNTAGGGGGQYKVWTFLPNDSNGSYKEYGGATGFKFYIDWIPEQTVFVAPGGTGNGVYPYTPAGTLAQAMATGVIYNRSEIVMSGSAGSIGTYNGTLTLPTATDQNFVFTGGYNTTMGLGGYPLWLRTAPTLNAVPNTRIVGVNGVGVQATGNNQTHFRNLRIDSGPSSSSNPSTYAVKLSGSAKIDFDSMAITSQNGANGTNGTDAAPQGDACTGAGGAAKSTSTVTGRIAAPARSVTWNNSVTGANHSSTVTSAACNPGGVRASGNGGAGGSASFFSANDGSPGGNGGHGAPGGGGGGAGFCGSTTGGVGGADNTPPGATAPATPAFPTVSASGWVGASGANGTPGPDGRGGGGAGGGGANNCFGVNSAGASGGAGGEGGLGGLAGGGGGPGGASVGIWDTGNAPSSSCTGTCPSNISFSNVYFAIGKGGDGGAGGRGGDGGYGGVGGQGAFNGAQGADSGGGGGGTGGDGGTGGGGGQAGPSIAIYRSSAGAGLQNNSTPTVVFNGGNPLAKQGAGGPGGVGGGGGAGGMGASGTVVYLFFFPVNYSTSPGFNAPGGAAGATGPVGLGGYPANGGTYSSGGQYGFACYNWAGETSGGAPSCPAT